MKLIAFEKKISKEDAWRMAQQKGSLLWKAVFAGNPLTEIQLKYIEYKIVEVKVEYKITPMLRVRTNLKNSFKSIFSNFVRGDRLRDAPVPMQIDKTKKYGEHSLLLIVNGTSGSPSLVDVMPKMVKIEMTEERYDRIVQKTDFTDDEIIRNAKKMAIRVMHRIVGGMPKIKDVTVKSIYRPFYVAFYGEVVEGNKVRYIPIPADGGHTTKRGEFA